jgi:hypothetical protein
MISILFALTLFSNPYGMAGCGNCCKYPIGGGEPNCTCETCGPDFIEPRQPQCIDKCRRTIAETGERVCNLPCIMQNAKAEKEPIECKVSTCPEYTRIKRILIVYDESIPQKFKNEVYDISDVNRYKEIMQRFLDRSRLNPEMRYSFVTYEVK